MKQNHYMYIGHETHNLLNVLEGFKKKNLLGKGF